MTARSIRVGARDKWLLFQASASVVEHPLAVVLVWRDNVDRIPRHGVAGREVVAGFLGGYGRGDALRSQRQKAEDIENASTRVSLGGRRLSLCVNQLGSRRLQTMSWLNAGAAFCAAVSLLCKTRGIYSVMVVSIAA